MFTKIKRELLNQNKIGRYLSYAIGEIVLIVVGILIAVSIKNWNEENRQREVINGIYAVIINDLKRDTAEVKRLLDLYDNRKATFLKVMNDTLSNDEILECDFCLSLVTNLKVLSINKRGFHQLNEYKGLTANVKDSLAFSIINFYSEMIDDVETFNDLIKANLSGTLIDWRDNQPWFSNIIQGNLSEESLSYFGRSQEYKNKVAYHYLIIYKNYVSILEEFQNDSERILDKLSER